MDSESSDLAESRDSDDAKDRSKSSTRLQLDRNGYHSSRRGTEDKSDNRSDRDNRDDKSDLRSDKRDLNDRSDRDDKYYRSDSRHKTPDNRADKSRNSDSIKPKSGGRKKLTEEEKEKLRSEMEAEALRIETERLEKITKYNAEESREKKEHLSQQAPKSGLGPKFINDMGKEVYEGKVTSSVADRLKRGVHYIQKTNLDEQGIFK